MSTNINEVGLEDIELMDDDEIVEENISLISHVMRERGYNDHAEVYTLNYVDVCASLSSYLVEHQINPNDVMKEISCIYREMNSGRLLTIPYGDAFDDIFDTVFNSKAYRENNDLETK